MQDLDKKEVANIIVQELKKKHKMMIISYILRSAQELKRMQVELKSIHKEKR
jgi:hypothetical protein